MFDIRQLNSLKLSKQLSGDLLLSFKKLRKKDPVTKIKGLKEIRCGENFPHSFSMTLFLSDACANLSADEIDAVLQNWTPVFVQLGVDYDLKVREAANRTMGVIAQTAKSKLGNYLKSFIVS